MTPIGAVFTFFMAFCGLVALTSIIDRGDNMQPSRDADTLSVPLVILLAVIAGAGTLALHGFISLYGPAK